MLYAWSSSWIQQLFVLILFLLFLNFLLLPLFILGDIWYIKPENWSRFCTIWFLSIYGEAFWIMAGASLGFLGLSPISMAVILMGLFYPSFVTILYAMVTLILTNYRSCNQCRWCSGFCASIGIGWAANYVSRCNFTLVRYITMIQASEWLQRHAMDIFVPQS